MMKQLRAGAPLAVGGSVLIPIERVVVRAESGRHGHWLSATKEVAAIVVCEPDGLRAIDVQAGEMPVDELIREVPGLAAVVGKVPGKSMACTRLSSPSAPSSRGRTRSARWRSARARQGE